MCLAKKANLAAFWMLCRSAAVVAFFDVAVAMGDNDNVYIGFVQLALAPSVVCRQYSVRWQIQAVNADVGTDAYAINPDL